MTGRTESPLSQILVVVRRRRRSADADAALGLVLVDVAGHWSAETVAALGLIEVEAGSCRSTGLLRPTLREVTVFSALFRDLSVGRQFGIGFRDLPLSCARGEGEADRGSEQTDGDDALDVLRGVHGSTFARHGMARMTRRYGSGMGPSRVR